METAVWIYILAPRSPTCVHLGIDSLLRRSFVPGFCCFRRRFPASCSRDQIPLPATIDELLLQLSTTYSLLPPPYTYDHIVSTRNRVKEEKLLSRRGGKKRGEKEEKRRESKEKTELIPHRNPKELFLARQAMGSGPTVLEPYTTDTARHQHHQDAARR